MRGHSGAVLSLAMSRAGEFCYSGGIDGTICCWNLPNICIDPYDAYGKLPQHSLLSSYFFYLPPLRICVTKSVCLYPSY